METGHFAKSPNAFVTVGGWEVEGEVISFCCDLHRTEGGFLQAAQEVKTDNVSEEVQGPNSLIDNWSGSSSSSTPCNTEWTLLTPDL